MHVVLGTLIRDGAGYFDRFASQVDQLAHLLPDFRVVIVVNDCTDDTPKLVHDWATNGADFPVQVVHLDTGSPMYPSVNVPERWRNFSKLGNRALREIRWPDEVLLWTYPDMIWNAGTLVGLADMAVKYQAGIAAMTLYHDHRYYDIWGTVRRGQQWRAHFPFYDGHGDERLVLVDSVAGCMAVPAQVASHTSWGFEAERSWCANLRDNGCPVMIDTASVVFHP